MLKHLASRLKRIRSRRPARAEPTPEAVDIASDVDIAEIEYLDGIAIATLTVTELLGPEGAAMIGGLLNRMYHAGSRFFALDIQNVQHMDSAALGQLIRAAQRLQQRGGKIALVNPDRSVDYLFRLTRLDRIFPVRPDVPGALAILQHAKNAGGQGTRAA